MILPLLENLSLKKKNFRIKLYNEPLVQKILIQRLKESGPSKLSDQYNSSIKGLNRKLEASLGLILEQLENNLNIPDLLEQTNLSYKIVFSNEIKECLPPNLLNEFESICLLRNEIVSKSQHILEASVARKLKFKHPSYEPEDLLQEAYIIAYESTITYNHDLAKQSELSWYSYLRNRLNKMLAKQMVESYHLVNIPRDKVFKKKVTVMSLSDDVSILEAKLISESSLEDELRDSTLHTLLQNSLTEKEYEYIARKYGFSGFNPHSLKDLEEHFKCKSSILISLEMTILKKLKGNLKRLNY